MSLSNSTLEPAEAVPRRVERDTYSVADVRKALCFLLAHVEKGDAPPTPWAVAHKLLKMPAMYARVCCLLPCADLRRRRPSGCCPAPPLPWRARAFRACGPAPTRVLKRSLLSGTPAHSSRMRGRRSRRCQPTRGAPRSPPTSCRERVARSTTSISSATRRRRFSSPSATWLR